MFSLRRKKAKQRDLPRQDRKAILLDGITKDQLGLEIGPFSSPLVPKRDGYNSRSADVFCKEDLIEKAKGNRNIKPDDVANIEEVDFVGDASSMASVIAAKGFGGAFDYIISSHNIEHLPNPVAFLQGTERLLKVGGKLILAVPDKRFCFDYFKPHTITADFIEAYFEDRKRPTAKQIFERHSLRANYCLSGQVDETFDISCDPRNVLPEFNLEPAFNEWRAALGGEIPYRDIHCWYFTPASLTVIFGDLRQLGLMNLVVDSVSETNGFEFYVKLSKQMSNAKSGEYELERADLLHRINDEIAQNSRANWAAE